MEGLSGANVKPYRQREGRFRSIEKKRKVICINGLIQWGGGGGREGESIPREFLHWLHIERSS